MELNRVLQGRYANGHEFKKMLNIINYQERNTKGIMRYYLTSTRLAIIRYKTDNTE